MRGARAILVAALLLGACNGGGGGGDDTTLPPRASTTASTVPDYSVPAVIDAAYVEKVMAALDHVYGDAIRILARERKITQDFLEHLVAIYGDAQFDRTQQIWVRDVAAGLPGLSAIPGNPRTVLQQIVRNDVQCLLLRVDRDFSATHEAPDTPVPQEFVALSSKQDKQDPRMLNPTPWVMTFDGYIATPAGAMPEKPCA